MITWAKNTMNYANLSKIEKQELAAHGKNLVGTTLFANNVYSWQQKQRNGLRTINITKYHQNEAVEKALMGTPHTVDKSLYNYQFLEADLKLIPTKASASTSKLTFDRNGKVIRGSPV